MDDRRLGARSALAVSAMRKPYLRHADEQNQLHDVNKPISKNILPETNLNSYHKDIKSECFKYCQRFNPVLVIQ